MPYNTLAPEPFHSKYLSFTYTKWFLFVGGLLLGTLAMLALLFVAYQADITHYRANFAVYLNCQRQQFKDPQY